MCRTRRPPAHDSTEIERQGQGMKQSIRFHPSAVSEWANYTRILDYGAWLTQSFLRRKTATIRKPREEKSTKSEQLREIERKMNKYIFPYDYFYYYVFSSKSCRDAVGCVVVRVGSLLSTGSGFMLPERRRCVYAVCVSAIHAQNWWDNTDEIEWGEWRRRKWKKGKLPSPVYKFILYRRLNAHCFAWNEKKEPRSMDGIFMFIFIHKESYAFPEWHSRKWVRASTWLTTMGMSLHYIRFAHFSHTS